MAQALQKPSVQLALAALAGVLYFLGFVGFGLWPLAFVFMTPALLAIHAATPRRALGLGVITGLVANLGGYYWVIHLLRDFADLSVPLAALGWVLLSLYQGALVGGVLYLVALGRDRLGVAPIWGLAVAFPALELAYPLLFPSYIGNALYRISVLTQIVELTGMLGLTVLLSLTSGAVYELVVARLVERRTFAARRLGAAAAALVLALGYGAVRLPQVDAATAAARKIDVALIQTNLGARDKHERREEFIERHQRMSKEALAAHPQLDLIVWPESAFNRAVHRSETNLAATITAGLRVPMIFGALTFDRRPGEDPEVYNSAMLTGRGGEVLGLFDKVELLAFGETIPLVDTFPVIKKWLPRSSTFVRGTTLKHLRSEGTAILPMICYEDIIPAFVRRVWRADGPAAALVNVTNDSWYGDTHEPLIHLALASFRTIETRRAMMRSTNTGISAFIDPAGRIVARTGQWTQETLVGQVPVIEDGSETVYMRLGDVVGWAALGLVLVGLAAVRRRRGRA